MLKIYNGTKGIVFAAVFFVTCSISACSKKDTNPYDRVLVFYSIHNYGTINVSINSATNFTSFQDANGISYQSGGSNSASFNCYYTSGTPDCSGGGTCSGGGAANGSFKFWKITEDVLVTYMAQSSSGQTWSGSTIVSYENVCNLKRLD